MSKRLLALNLLLAAAALFFFIELVRVLSVPRPLPQPSAQPASQGGAAPKENPAPARPQLTAYSAVATRNLFNPDRTEATSQTARRAPAAKPVLHGVVIDGATQLAYLEDPTTKRVFGYRIGDAVAGGQLERIETDRVVIKLADGPLEVMLKDPSKPKPPVVATPAAPPAAIPPAGVPPRIPSIAPSPPRAIAPTPPAGVRPPALLRRPPTGAETSEEPAPTQ